MPTNPKPILKVSLIPVFRVHFEDLERYIKTVFGFDFDLLFLTGTVAGVIPEYQVNGRIVNDAHKRQAEQIKNGQRNKNLRLILNVLAAEGYIHFGRYIIDTNPKPNPTDLYRSLLEAGYAPDSQQCVAFKHEHRDNPTFVERAAILDTAVLEEMERGK